MNIINIEPNLSKEERKNKEQEVVNAIYRIIKQDENLKIIEKSKGDLLGA